MWPLPGGRPVGVLELCARKWPPTGNEMVAPSGRTTLAPRLLIVSLLVWMGHLPGGIVERILRGSLSRAAEAIQLCTE